jgi:hypothetical protein
MAEAGPASTTPVADPADLDGFAALVASSADVPQDAFFASLDRYDPKVVAGLRAAIEAAGRAA